MAEEDDKKGDDDTNKVLMETLSSMQQTLTALPNLIAAGFAEVAGQINIGGGDNKNDVKISRLPENAPSADDIDRMTNSELVSHMSDSIGAVLEDKLKGVDSRVNDLGGRLDAGNVTAQLEKLTSSGGAMFEGLKPEMMALLKENPAHVGNLEDAFIVVKGRHPEKVADIQKAIDEADKGEEDGEEKPEFGGLLNTHTAGDVEDGEKGRMDFKNAAEAAWADTMGSINPAFLSEEGST